MIAWACVLCTHAGFSAEEAMAETAPATVPSSSLPTSTQMSASQRAERLGALTEQGRRCKDEGDHDCVIDRYVSAYQLLDHGDRTGRLGIQFVDLMIESCDALAEQADVMKYRSRFEVFGSLIELQLAEIDSRHPTESTRKRGRKSRRHRQQDERLQEQRARLEESKLRLEELQHRLAAEEAEETSPPPTIVVIPEREDPGGAPLDPTSVPRPDPNPFEQEDVEDDSHRANTRRFILGTIGIAGGSLATLTGIALMINGSAWTQCKHRSEDGSPSTECNTLAGARDGITFFPTDNPEGREVDTDTADQKSVRNWVSGSITTAAGIAAVGWAAWAVKRSRDEYREREGDRKRDRARARRESIALAPSWSPLVPRQGGLSITGRF
jgi:hypothetical protein